MIFYLNIAITSNVMESKVPRRPIAHNLRNFTKLNFQSCKKLRQPTIFYLENSIWENERSEVNRKIPVKCPERSEMQCGR